MRNLDLFDCLIVDIEKQIDENCIAFCDLRLAMVVLDLTD